MNLWFEGHLSLSLLHMYANVKINYKKQQSNFSFVDTNKRLRSNYTITVLQYRTKRL